MSAIPQQLPVTVRPMREADLNRVIAVEQLAYTYPWTRGIFHDCLRVGYNCWVWEQDDEIVAYSVMSIAADEAHLLNLCVSPEHQRRGLGRRALAHMLDLARRRGVEATLLEVRPSNKVAVRLYETMGFSEVGIRRNYYPARGGREDAIIMAVPL